MNKKKLIFSYVYIVATIVVISILVSNSLEVGQFRNALSNLSTKWIGVCILGVFMYWITDALLLKQIISYSVQNKKGFWACFKYSIIGLYYGALTPFASGGQPIQIIYMKKDNMDVGKSTAVISIKFFAYGCSMCIIYILCMMLRGGYLYANYPSIFWISAVGFLVNLLGVVGIVLAMLNSDFGKKICNWFINAFFKLKIIKHPEKPLAKVDKVINDFSNASSYILIHKRKTLLSVLTSCLNMFFLLIIPYLVYRAFGLNQYNWLDLFALNTFMYLSIAFIPTPGATFAAEGGFRLMFFSMFGNVIMLAIALWRILTYYIILIAGSVFVIINQISNVHLRRNDIRGRRVEVRK